MKQDKFLKEQKQMEITKHNIFMWPIRNLIKVWIVFFILIMLLLIIIALIYGANVDKFLTISWYAGVFALSFAFLTLGPFSYHSYKALLLLRRQEKYLHVNMEEELKGMHMKGSSYEAMYEDENWFICYGGSFINVYNKKYIVDIEEEPKISRLRTFWVVGADGKVSKFILADLYGKAFPKFKHWFHRKKSLRKLKQ